MVPPFCSTFLSLPLFYCMLTSSASPWISPDFKRATHLDGGECKCLWMSSPAFMARGSVLQARLSLPAVICLFPQEECCCRLGWQRHRLQLRRIVASHGNSKMDFWHDGECPTGLQGRVTHYRAHRPEVFTLYRQIQVAGSQFLPLQCPFLTGTMAFVAKKLLLFWHETVWVDIIWPSGKAIFPVDFFSNEPNSAPLRPFQARKMDWRSKG